MNRTERRTEIRVQGGARADSRMSDDEPEAGLSGLPEEMRLQDLAEASALERREDRGREHVDRGLATIRDDVGRAVVLAVVDDVVDRDAIRLADQ
jgi:hypothetical protein